MGTATEIASQVRTGRLRATEVVAEALAAAEDAHAALNAFTLIDSSGAMRRAEAIDALVASGLDPGPLAGVPIAVKDLIDDAGVPNSCGASFPPRLPEQSATVVRRIGAAGGVIIGRTGLHEFAFGFTSENPWFGPVRNPWDPATSPGGSSGGSGAVVAAGVTPIAIGTDTGGSVRVPAALCGVFGLKVTHGRVPLTGVFPLAPSLDTVGPMAASIDDLTAAYLAIAGDDPDDPWSQPHEVDAPTRLDAGGIHVGVVAQWSASTPTTEDIADAFAAFLERCRTVGVTVHDIDEPTLAPLMNRAIGAEVLAVHGDRFASDPERYGTDVAARLVAARRTTAADVLDAERWGSAARATIARLAADGIHAVVSPTVGARTKVIGVDTIDVAGRHLAHRDVLAGYTAPINRMRVPALAAPAAGTGGPAVSVQFVGPMWSEARLLGVADALARAGVLEAGQPTISFARGGR